MGELMRLTPRQLVSRARHLARQRREASRPVEFMLAQLTSIVWNFLYDGKTQADSFMLRPAKAQPPAPKPVDGTLAWVSLDTQLRLLAADPRWDAQPSGEAAEEVLDSPHE